MGVGPEGRAGGTVEGKDPDQRTGHFGLDHRVRLRDRTRVLQRNQSRTNRALSKGDGRGGEGPACRVVQCEFGKATASD